MHTKRIFPLLLCLALLYPLFLAACSNSSLEKINGQWLIDVEKTIAADPALQGDGTFATMERDMTKAVLRGMELAFDVPKKTVSGKLIGISFSNESFGVVSDSADAVTILVLRTKYTCSVVNNTLHLKNEDGGIVIFNRATK